jgi:hypothetical protein
MGIRSHPPMDFRWVEYDLINPFKEESLKLSDDHVDPMHRYLLCSKRLMGFVLKTRTWGKPPICQLHLSIIRVRDNADSSTRIA